MLTDQDGAEDEFDLDEVLSILARAIAGAGGTNIWARQAGLSGSFVSAVVGRRKAPSSRLLAALGIERFEVTTTTYRQMRT